MIAEQNKLYRYPGNEKINRSYHEADFSLISNSTFKQSELPYNEINDSVMGRNSHLQMFLSKGFLINKKTRHSI